MEDLKIDALLGKTLADIKQDNDSITFTTTEGEVFMMYHQQNCCEGVYIESIVGDLTDLIGNPILVAEESTSNEVIEGPVNLGKWDEQSDSFTWTFYKLATIKGHVDIRWFGQSNGYYSESVDFGRIQGPESTEADK